jgi:ABC-type dipeptide/oligopeptide/nickel transport system permease component
MQSTNVMRDHLARPHAALQRATGAKPLELRRILLHNVLVELAPSLEKAMAWLLANLMFTEVVLGLPGIGSMAVRALRRSDPYLILATVLVFAVIINTMRVVAVGLRYAYGFDTKRA